MPFFFQSQTSKVSWHSYKTKIYAFPYISTSPVSSCHGTRKQALNHQTSWREMLNLSFRRYFSIVSVPSVHLPASFHMSFYGYFNSLPRKRMIYGIHFAYIIPHNLSEYMRASTSKLALFLFLPLTTWSNYYYLRASQSKLIKHIICATADEYENRASVRDEWQSRKLLRIIRDVSWMPWYDTVSRVIKNTRISGVKIICHVNCFVC